VVLQRLAAHGYARSQKRVAVLHYEQIASQELASERIDTMRQRFLDVQEILPQDEIYNRISRRYGFSADQLADIETGELLAEPAEAVSGERGVFEHSTKTYLDAERHADGEDFARAQRYLRYECHTALFETVGARGQAEKLEYEIDQDSGDAFITTDKQLGETFLMDLPRQRFKWRARLSWRECVNNEYIGELTQRGVLADAVFTEFSCFPFHAEKTQAESEGYNTETYKAFFRTSHTDDEASVRTIETLSYTDLRPSDVQLLRVYFGLQQDKDADSETVLAQPLLIPKTWYEQNGGIGGLAMLVDKLKQEQDGLQYKFGELVEGPVNIQAYFKVAEVSAERKLRAAPVVEAFMQDILALARNSESGLISPDERRQKTKQLIIDYRLQILGNDIQLAEEQYGSKVAQSLQLRNELLNTGRFDEADVLAHQLQTELGAAFICGMMILVNEEGKIVDKDGNERKDCEELKNNQLVTCPKCHKKVRVIVENRETAFCPREECALSKAGGKGSVKAKKLPKAKPPKKTQQSTNKTPDQLIILRELTASEASSAGSVGATALAGVH
jgi:hypothetical protein